MKKQEAVGGGVGWLKFNLSGLVSTPATHIYAEYKIYILHYEGGWGVGVGTSKVVAGGLLFKNKAKNTFWGKYYRLKTNAQTYCECASKRIHLYSYQHIHWKCCVCVIWNSLDFDINIIMMFPFRNGSTNFHLRNYHHFQHYYPKHFKNYFQFPSPNFSKYQNDGIIIWFFCPKMSSILNRSKECRVFKKKKRKYSN